MTTSTWIPAAVALALLAGCSSDDDGDGDDDATTTTTVAFATTTIGGADAEGRIASRQAVVEFVQQTVLDYGIAALDAAAVGAAIQIAYPGVTVVGPDTAASPTTVSLRIDLREPGAVDGADNPWFVTVAVADTSGGCLGGVVTGHPLPTQRSTVEAPPSCTAAAVFEAATAG